jgi:hypothetical protein
MSLYFACGSVVRFYLCHKKMHVVHFFVTKRWSLPPCRRRIGPFIQANTWFGTNRVTPVTVACARETGVRQRIEWEIHQEVEAGVMPGV